MGSGAHVAKPEWYAGRSGNQPLDYASLQLCYTSAIRDGSLAFAEREPTLHTRFNGSGASDQRQRGVRKLPQSTRPEYRLQRGFPGDQQFSKRLVQCLPQHHDERKRHGIELERRAVG